MLRNLQMSPTHQKPSPEYTVTPKYWCRAKAELNQHMLPTRCQPLKPALVVEIGINGARPNPGGQTSVLSFPPGPPQDIESAHDAQLDVPAEASALPDQLPLDSAQTDVNIPQAEIASVPTESASSPRPLSSDPEENVDIPQANIVSPQIENAHDAQFDFPGDSSTQPEQLPLASDPDQNDESPQVEIASAGQIESIRDARNSSTKPDQLRLDSEPEHIDIPQADAVPTAIESLRDAQLDVLGDSSTQPDQLPLASDSEQNDKSPKAEITSVPVGRAHDAQLDMPGDNPAPDQLPLDSGLGQNIDSPQAETALASPLQIETTHDAALDVPGDRSTLPGFHVNDFNGRQAHVPLERCTSWDDLRLFLVAQLRGQDGSHFVTSGSFGLLAPKESELLSSDTALVECQFTFLVVYREAGVNRGTLPDVRRAENRLPRVNLVIRRAPRIQLYPQPLKREYVIRRKPFRADPEDEPPTSQSTEQVTTSAPGPETSKTSFNFLTLLHVTYTLLFLGLPDRYFREAPKTENLDGDGAGAGRNFCQRWINEWTYIGGIALVISGLLVAMLQTSSGGNDPIVHTLALLSMVCLFAGAGYAATLVMTFGRLETEADRRVWMRVCSNSIGCLLSLPRDSPAQQAMRAMPENSFWNPWIMLATPLAWISWGVFYGVVLRGAFIWRDGATNEPDENSRLLPHQAYGPKVVEMLIYVVGLGYFGLIVKTVKGLGSAHTM
ncbi:hypothetical protein B0H13DRAFT_2485834 [Mycena leptocephala]|nr:hypothetical protein B0H13DRAFT_2485834 [Mycena leptocephala]